ncbi:hypothetical protein [Mesorhizobium sp. B2-6-5]|uniref:hypothetical protein n=1 Tax=Mesorhizobium sp. B2-6-5 TaxID=2589912 RepID=UPI0011281EB8|nr:hypothetical protein [Mesorhizobium sp. B2-6-5]TPJ32732.1 hypothetical protein FJ432_32020 [Mesorhizobium sp. B2-6-5]
MLELLYNDENRQGELAANLKRDRPEIQRAVKKACKVLNRLSPDGAIYGSGWVLADLIVSLMDDEEGALELLRMVQGQIEREFKMAYADKRGAAPLN